MSSYDIIWAKTEDDNWVFQENYEKQINNNNNII